MPGFGKTPASNYVISYDSQILCHDSLPLSVSTTLIPLQRRGTFTRPIDMVGKKNPNHQTSMGDEVKLSMLSTP